MEHYKGYDIDPRPRLIVDSKKWRVEFFIKFGEGHTRSSDHRFTQGTYETKEEAVRQCLIEAKIIIDKRVE